MAIDSPERPVPVGPSLPEWTRPDEQASPLVLGLVALAAIAFDLAVRTHPVGLAGVIYVALLACAVLSAGRTVNPQARALAVVAMVFGLWLAFRASPWLSPLNVLAAGACLVGSASLSRGGSVLDISAPNAVLRAVHAAANGVLGLGLLARGRGTRLAPVLRGLAIAVPLALALGLLLAAGDAVFASAFRFDAGDLVPHAIVLVIGAWVAAGLVRIERTPSISGVRADVPKLGPVEWTIVLVALDLLYAGFVVARIVAATEGGARVLETSGLTYAEYARSGFFELLAAAAITLVALLALRAGADVSAAGARSRFVVLATVAVLLTIVVVASAFQRLVLYERAFGLSMLRLYSMVFCVWLVIALVWLGLWIAGIGGHRPWFWSAAAATALALLLALNVANPEAMVVRHNSSRSDPTTSFDFRYATELSADAVPALMAAIGRLDEHDEYLARVKVCTFRPDADGWPGFNLARSRAREALASFCASHSRDRG